MILISAGAAAPLFLLEYGELTHTCHDPFRIMNVPQWFSGNSGVKNEIPYYGNFTKKLHFKKKSSLKMACLFRRVKKLTWYFDMSKKIYPFNFRHVHFLSQTAPKFWKLIYKYITDLYSTVVTVFTYILPVLVLPLALPTATLRTCISRQCCVMRFKQPIGELIMTSIVCLIYLGTIIGVILPRIDAKYDKKVNTFYNIVNNS